MHEKSNHFSHTQNLGGHSGSIKRTAGDVLVIHDIPTNLYLKRLAWIMAGSATAIAILSIVMSQNLSAMLVLISVLLAFAAMSRGINTVINLHDGTIRITRGIGIFVWHRIYSLDDYETVMIKDKGRVFEGYSMPFFSVQLIGRRKQIRIYSTEDSEEAKSVQGEVSFFLDKIGTSTRWQQ